MDYNVFNDIIANQGFPICMCIVLIYYIFTSQKQLTEAINELRETLKEIKQQIYDLRRDK